MGADNFIEYCTAALMFAVAASLVIFVGSTIVYCLAHVFRGWYDHCMSKTTIVEEDRYGIRLEDDGKPRVTDFLLKKVYSIEHQPRESHVELDAKGKQIIGLTCPICSNDFGNNADKANLWVTIMPSCFHICHTACLSKKLKSQRKKWLPFKSQKNCCPSCSRAVDLKGLKEMKITSKPYKVKSNNGEVA